MARTIPESGERYLALEGSYNLRDIGGYATRQGGQTRWRTVFRSDGLHRLTAAGQTALIEYGLTTVIDLRSFSEAGKAPSVFIDSPEVIYRHIPLIADFDETPIDERPVDLESFYYFVLDRFQPQLRAVLEMLARPATPPVLIHCTAGKDRTGVVIALLLSLANVPNETIVEDYLLTDRYIDPLRVELRAEARQAGFDMERYERMLACPAEAMVSTLDYLRARYDGAEPFCRAIGLADYQIRQLKRILVA